MRFLAIFLLLFTIILLASCGGPLDQVITRENASEVYQSIKSGEIKDTTASKFLTEIKSLAAFSQGREGFLSFEGSESSGLENFFVEEALFEQEVTNLFEHFDKKGITYSQYLVELNSSEQTELHAKREMEKIEAQIDQECTKIQDRIDSLRIKRINRRNEIIGMAELSLISVENTTINDINAKLITVKITNKGDCPAMEVKADVSFTTDYGDYLGAYEVATTSAFSESTTVEYTILEYDSEGTRQIEFANFDNYYSPDLYFDAKATEIICNGKPVNDDDIPYEKDQYYKTPKELNGKCPYLDKDHELKKKLNEAAHRWLGGGPTPIKDKIGTHMGNCSLGFGG